MLEIKFLGTDEEKAVLLDQPELDSKVEFFNPVAAMRRQYLAAFLKGKVVGMVCLVPSSIFRPGALGVSFVSTHEDYQNQGIAKQLVRALFEYARSVGKPISNTPYEPMGRVYLKHVMQRTSREFADVPFFERY